MGIFKQTRATQLRSGLDVGKTERPDENKRDTTSSSKFYKPTKDEVKPRAKDIANPAQRKAAQYKKGMLKRAPGVTTEEGKKYVEQLEETTGQKQSKIGTYKEAPGGGTPLAKGQKAPSDEWVKEHRQMQPRDPETGQFEYNNANAKGVKYPSRGKKFPTFVKGLDFNKVFKPNVEHIIITDENKTAIARLNMNKDEFVEAVVGFSEKLGFTTKWSVESKKGRKSNYEKELLEKGEERGRIGKRVETGKDYGPEKVSKYDTKKNTLFNKSYTRELTPAQERVIASMTSNPEEFVSDIKRIAEVKGYQRLNVAQQHRNSLASTNLEQAKKEGKPISQGMINAAKNSKNYYE